MQVIVNGETRLIPAGLNVVDLLEDLGLSRQRVAVEVNRHIVRRAEHGAHQLADGDVIEIVTLVGGG